MPGPMAVSGSECPHTATRPSSRLMVMGTRIRPILRSGSSARCAASTLGSAIPSYTPRAVKSAPESIGSSESHGITPGRNIPRILARVPVSSSMGGMGFSRTDQRSRRLEPSQSSTTAPSGSMYWVMAGPRYIPRSTPSTASEPPLIATFTGRPSRSTVSPSPGWSAKKTSALSRVSLSQSTASPAKLICSAGNVIPAMPANLSALASK